MKHILVATDFSDTAAAALREGAKLASLSGARLTLLHVIFTQRVSETLLGLDTLEHLAFAADQVGDRSKALASLTEEAQHKLGEAVGTLPERPANFETKVTEGRPSNEIAAYASSHNVDLIVMGTHGRSALGKAFIGSVADHVIRMVECPVMVVRK
jgi:nucleotide-binding universal stress UspA family protein